MTKLSAHLIAFFIARVGRIDRNRVSAQS